ncbi:hypothetical protein AAFF_G00034560 [Aldrovandia affinis]|uniref:Homeobox domain-containing protein n=1 Tax=Aldrovandia affinis TaxID=143900 RepID=A0AAD7S3G1_9TELE|nr:hypothetical protein AAFF_G00034560 [Aldrovandia affinis]
MWYPQGYLYQASGSSAVGFWPGESSERTASRSEDSVSSSSSSAFCPFPGSAAFAAHGTDFCRLLRYSADLATGFPAYMGSLDDADTRRMAESIRYHPYGSLTNPNQLTDPVYRNNLARGATATLKSWLQEHKKNPYPTKGEKIMLAFVTKMTLTQVSTWFANARRRLKKDNEVSWVALHRGEEEDENEECEDGGKNVDLSENCMDNSEPSGKEEGMRLHVENPDYHTQSDGARVSCRRLDTVSEAQVMDNDKLDGGLSPNPAISSAKTTVEAPHRNHHHLDSNDSSVSNNKARLDREMSSVTHTQAAKPKLWSLAEIATSDQKELREENVHSPVISSTSLATSSWLCPPCPFYLGTPYSSHLSVLS